METITNTSGHFNNLSLEKQIKQLEEWIKNPPGDAKRVMIMPKFATWVLENKNTRNRPFRKKIYHLLSTHGYRFLGETLVFGTGGGLLNGQNRLKFCAETGQPMDIYLAFGVLDNDFSLIDSGAKRTSADAFEAARPKIKNAQVVGPSVRWLMNLSGHGDSEKPTDRTTFDNKTMFDWFDAHITDKKLLVKFASIAIKLQKRKIPPAPLTAILYIGAMNGFDKECDIFVENLEFAKGSVKKLITRIQDIKSNRNRVKDTNLNAWIIQAIKSPAARKIEWWIEGTYPEFVPTKDIKL